MVDTPVHCHIQDIDVNAPPSHHGPMLEILDLDADQQQVYEALVEGAATVAELIQTLEFSEPRLRKALLSLERLNLVERVADRRGAPARYFPVAPDTAFAALLSAREKELSRARRHVQLLNTKFRVAHDPSDPLDLVEVVIGRNAVMQQVDELQRSAHHQVRGIDRPPYANSGPDRLDPETGMMPVQLETMRRGVSYRVIYDSEGLSTVHLQTDFLACSKYGEEARVMRGTPTKLLMADDSLCIIPLRSESYQIASSVIVHPSGLLEALARFFEVLWSRAEPILGHGDHASVEPHGLDQEDARLLALLTTGLTDQVIAKQLGVSHRTFQRRLKSLMEQLGVTTRFQLGMHAASMGWLTSAPPADCPV